MKKEYKVFLFKIRQGITDNFRDSMTSRLSKYLKEIYGPVHIVVITDRFVNDFEIIPLPNTNILPTNK